MAADITNVNTGNVVPKHNTVVVNIPGTGYQTLDTVVANTPTLANISGKYIDRFDDPTYYTA